MSSTPYASAEEAAAVPAPGVPQREVPPPPAPSPNHDWALEYDFDFDVDAELQLPGWHNQNIPRAAPLAEEEDTMDLGRPEPDNEAAALFDYLTENWAAIVATKRRHEPEEAAGGSPAKKSAVLSAAEELARNLASVKESSPTQSILPENKPTPHPGVENLQQVAMQSGLAPYHNMYEEPEPTEGMEIDVAALMPEWNDEAGSTSAAGSLKWFELPD